MKMVRSVDGAKNIHINFPSPENFIGMTIDKTNTISSCYGIEDYTNIDGEKTKLLLWEVVLKETGEKIIRKTASRNFRVSDLPGTEKPFKRK